MATEYGPADLVFCAPSLSRNPPTDRKWSPNPNLRQTEYRYRGFKRDGEFCLAAQQTIQSMCD